MNSTQSNPSARKDLNNDLNPTDKSFNYLYYLVKNKWFILITTLLFTVGGVIYSLYIAEPQFKSVVSVVPPKMSDDDSGGSAIQAAMRNFGVSSLIGSSSDEGYSMMVLLSARTAMDSLIDKYNLIEYYEVEEESLEETRDLLYENLEADYEKEGNYVVSVWDKDPELAAQMANDYIRIVNSIAAKIYKEETVHNLKHLEDRITTTDSTIALYSDSLAKFSAENKMFEPETQAKRYAESIAELKAEEVMADISYNLAQGRYGDDNNETIQLERLRTQLSEKISQIENTPGFAGNFTMNNATSKAIEYYQLYANIEAFTKLKALIMPMLEKTRLDAVKAQRYFYVVDEAIPAEKKDRPKRSLIVLGTMVGGIATSVLILMLIAGYKVAKSKAYTFEL